MQSALTFAATSLLRRHVVHALTGKFPFGNGGQMQILQRKLLNQFVPLRC